MLNLASNLERNAALFPDKLVVHAGAHSLSYAQLDAAANQLANGLRALGIGRGDKVALTCPNLPYFPIAYYAILRSARSWCRSTSCSRRREIAYHLETADARAYLCFEGSAELPMGKEGRDAFAPGRVVRTLLPDDGQSGGPVADRRLQDPGAADPRPSRRMPRSRKPDPTTPR